MMEKRVLEILFKNEIIFLKISINKYFTKTLQNIITQRCLVGDFNGQSIGEESFETLVHIASTNCEYYFN